MVEGGKNHWVPPPPHTLGSLQSAGGDGTDAGQYKRRQQSCPATSTFPDRGQQKKAAGVLAELDL